MNIHLNK